MLSEAHWPDGEDLFSLVTSVVTQQAHLRRKKETQREKEERDWNSGRTCVLFGHGIWVILVEAWHFSQQNGPLPARRKCIFFSFYILCVHAFTTHRRDSVCICSSSAWRREMWSCSPAHGPLLLFSSSFSSVRHSQLWCNLWPFFSRSKFTNVLSS